MAFDGIVTKAIVAELNNLLLSGKIDKISMPNKQEILLGIYCNRKNYKLLLSIHPTNGRVCLINYSKPNPIKAFNFCMLLRKYLLGAKVLSVSSSGLERVIEIDLENLNELNDKVTYKLIIEIMRKYSNIILCNSNGTIIDSIKHVDSSMSSVREVLPARPYSYPLQNDRLDFLSTTFENFKEIVNLKLSSMSLEKAIASSFVGFSIPFVSNIIKTLNSSDLALIYNYIKELLNNINDHKYTCENILNSNGNIKDFYIVNNSSNVNNDYMNNFVDDFYYSKETLELTQNLRDNLLKIVLADINKKSKVLTNINKKLDECKKMNIYNLYGELLTANLYKFKDNLDYVEVENYYDNNSIIKIPLDKQYTPTQNAVKFYKKYNKLKNTKIIVSKQLEIIENSYKYLESIIYELQSASTYDELSEIKQELENEGLIAVKAKQKKDIKSEPLSFVIDDFNVFVGKNNRQNDNLTLKFAKKTDIWLHTQEIHGSHTIIQTNGKSVSLETLKKVASLVATIVKQEIPLMFL